MTATERPVDSTGPRSSDEQGPRHDDYTGGPGRTDIDDQVVEKVAARAVTEVEHVGGAAGRVLGLAVGSDSADRSPKVSARVDGSIVTLDVRLSVIYPAPVGKVTQEVREHVIDRVATLTGLSVRRLDITVAALHIAQPSRRSVA